MDKERFDDAIGEVPRSTVDVDAAIARGRRAARLRSVATPSVGVAAAVVLTVGAVAFTTSGPGVTPAATPTSPPASCWNVPGRVDDESSAEDMARLTAVLRELVDERLDPGEQLAEDPQAIDHDGEQRAPLEFFTRLELPSVTSPPPVDCRPGEYVHYAAEARVVTDGRWGGFHVNLTTGDSWTPRCAPEVVNGVTQSPVCHSFTGAGGERIHTQAWRHPDGFEMNVVVVHKPDGTHVEIMLTNGNSPYLPHPPLTVEQAVEIAVDPELTLFS